MCLEWESGRLCSMVYPDTEAELTSSSPDHPLALVKLNSLLIFSQLSGTFLSHQEFSLRTGSNLAILSAPLTYFGASHHLLPKILLPCCWLPLPLQFTPVCTKVWVRMRQQIYWVLQHIPCHEVWESQPFFIWCGVATQHKHQSLCGCSVLYIWRRKLSWRWCFSPACSLECNSQ